MARLRRDARLESRDARARLAQNDDRNGYWRTIERGLAIGYYKGRQGGTWFVRRYQGGRIVKARLALADDASDSNGTTILSFAEAQRKALGTSETLKPRDERRYTVADAVADYVEHLKVRAKSWRDTEMKLRAHVLPKLSALQLSELTPEVIRRWRDAVARATRDRGRPRRARRLSKDAEGGSASNLAAGAAVSQSTARAAAGQSPAGAAGQSPTSSVSPASSARGSRDATGEAPAAGTAAGKSSTGGAAGARAGGAAAGEASGAVTPEVDLQRRKQATANRVFNALRACLNHAWRDGKIETDSAWRRVPAFRNVEAPVIRFLTSEEALRLVNASDPEFRPLVQAALYTGCRYGELCALKVADFDHENATLAIRHSKSGRPRHVYLAGEGAEFFEALSVGRPREALIFSHADGSPWRASNQHRPMRDACRHAEIDPPVSFHILRHSYASLLTKAGVPLQVVASALGHADARMTEKHYAHLAPSHVAQLIRDNLPSLSGGAAKKPRKVSRIRP